jgi:adenosylcobinamide-phosphate synthase
VIVGGVAFLATIVFRLLPLPVKLIMEAALLKLCLSMRGLTKAAKEIHDAMTKGDLDEGRRLVSWHLVSRDTSSLGEGHVASATVESVAENLCDGIIGPIFWYALAGLPGVWIYRFINTADSILGYRTADLEWVGKVPARLDDIANFIPARLSALLLLMAAPLMKINPISNIRICLRDPRSQTHKFTQCWVAHEYHGRHIRNQAGKDRALLPEPRCPTS